MLIRRLLLLILAGFSLVLTNCYNAPRNIKPASWVFKHMPENASETFKQGWMDGCESGLSSMTNTAYKTFYSFKQNAALRSDPEYYMVWKDTYTYCRHYVYGTIRQSDQRMYLPNTVNEIQQSFFGAENLLSHGILNMWGPGGKALLPLSNVGEIAGTGAWPLDIGGISGLDYRDDYVLGGTRGGIMTHTFPE